MTDTSTTIKGGIGFGSALAIAISWHATSRSCGPIAHGILGWLDVIDFALTR